LVQAKKYFKKGLNQSACELYKKSISSTYDIEKTLLLASEACYQCADYKASRIFLDQIKSTQRKYNSKLSYQAARLHHAEGNYKEATVLYKEYLRKTKRDNDQRLKVKSLLQQAWSGIRWTRKEKNILVQNAGRTVNTVYDDRYPVPSPTVPNKYYFSRSDSTTVGGARNHKGRAKGKFRHYRMDIVSSELVNGRWLDVQPMDILFNSPMHDHVVDFTQDGQVMIYYKGLGLSDGEVKTDTFSREDGEFRKQGLFPRKFGKDFDLYMDRIIVFSSDREGGFGGKDLYMSTNIDGIWSLPKNLGGKVNSEKDETSPFLAQNGRSLFFSSNRDEGLGGFDVYRSNFSSLKNTWDKSEHLGNSINSPRDELDYRLSPDGNIALLSSNRVGGKGGMDIYMVYLENQAIEQLQSPTVESLDKWVRNTEVKSLGREDEVIQTPAELSKPKIAIKRFDVDEIYYKDERFIKFDATSKAIDKIVNILKEAPRSKVIVYGHTATSKNDAKNLFFAAQYAQKVKDELIDRGISSGRIIIKSYGSRRPKVVFSSAQNVLNEKWNNRLDFRIIQSAEDDHVQISYNEKSTPENIEEGKKYNALTGLNYRVLVVQSEQMLNNPEVLQFPSLIVEQRGQGIFRYMLEDIKTYEEAKSIKNELINKGDIVPRIIPYIGEEPIPSREIIRLSLRYPDLKDYNRDQ